MKHALQVIVRLGCLASMLAPIIGIVLYPRANWLFAFTLVGIAILVFTILARKAPTAAGIG